MGVNVNCPQQSDGCTGTALERADEARSRARAIDLNRPWPVVRDWYARNRVQLRQKRLDKKEEELIIIQIF